MNTYDAILTRRSTRRYLAKPVEQELLENVVEAGRYAPTGSNTQSNHFIVIQNAAIIRKLAELVEAAFAQMTVQDGMYSSLRSSITRAKQGGYVFCYNAPVLVIVANQKDYGNNQADCAIAIENMMLAANELNLGSCYINQLKWLNEDESLVAYLQSLGMKENERVYGSMILGWPDTPDRKPERTPLKRTGNEVTWH